MRKPLLVAATTALALLGTAAPASAEVGGPWKRARAAKVKTVTTTTSPTVQVDAASTYAARLLTLVNAERAKAGLRALQANSCAGGFATTHAQKMAATGTFAHQDLGPVLGACAAGRVGENIAYGGVTADAMMQMWMNSAGHRANILNPAFTHMGNGAAKTAGGTWYGVQVFLTK